MEEELERAFAQEGFKFENDEAKKECATLCTSFGLSPSDLVMSWDVFYMNAQLDTSTVLASNVSKFRLHLQSQQREAFVREHGDMHLYSVNDVEMLDAVEVDKTQQEVMQTPSKPMVPQEVVTRRLPVTTPKQVSSPTTPFSQRTSRCVVQYVFNENLPESLPNETTNRIEDPENLVIRRLKDIRRCDLEVLSSGVTAGSRYMRDQLESRVNELERRMKRFAKAFTDNDSRSVSQPVAYAFQEIVPVVGRICYDAEEGERNMVLLEGSIEYSGGERIRLDLRELSNCSFFPGQIVIVEGQNPSGHCLIVSRVLGSIPLPPYSAPSVEEPAAKRQATEHISKLILNETPDSLTILVASGPFTTSDNFSFEPLVELLSYARKKRPNVLLLMGPFIDAEHPLVKTGAIDRVLSHVFQEEIRTRVEDYCQDLGEGARVVLVPSTRDAFHDRVFPQPPFDTTIFEDPSRQITLLPNPCVIRLDEVAIGICTTDILRHFSAEELFYNTAGISSDRMTRLGAHLIGQRSFYPLFPPAVGTNLDVSLKPTALDLPCTPEILLLPSDLVPCVKPLKYSPGIKLEQPEVPEEKTSLLVNPGRLAKGVMGGTFIEMFVAPQVQGGDVHERAKLTVMRI